MNKKIVLVRKYFKQSFLITLYQFNVAENQTTDSCSKHKIDLIKYTKKFEIFLKNIITRLNALNMTHNDRNTVVSMFEEIIEVNNEIHVSVFQDLNDIAAKNISHKINNHIVAEIQAYNSRFKRDKLIADNEYFVRPYEFGIGFRTDLDVRKNILKNIQCTFQYVSILETLQSLFSNQQFTELYFEYNKGLLNDNDPEVYKTFNSGLIFKENKFFQDNLHALQLQLSCDDFEITSIFGNKTSIHKVRAVFLQIKNIPPQLLSLINNIYLVSVANANDIKHFDDGFNQILNLIVNEINYLATTGLHLSEDKVIKGTLVNFAFDNLAGNECFGFYLSFNANYFCRMCTSTKLECKQLLEQSTAKLRTFSHYNTHVNNYENQIEPDFGYKKYCVLNDIEHFHILTNWSVDIMHDVMEGLIVFLLTNVFEYIVKKNILSEGKLKHKLLSFNYGILNIRNRPADFGIKKSGLGFIAVQLYCVMQFMPFVFYELKEQLIDIWDSVESLLQLMQIVFSTSIAYEHVDRLETVIKEHLKSMIKNFQITLKPKHHIVTHYPTVIRRMGPLIYNWTMRTEAKNKTLIGYMKGQHCFINVSKTIAYRHQMNLIHNIFTDIPNTAVTKLNKLKINDKFYNFITSKLENTNIHTIENLAISDNIYTEGLVMIKGTELLEIKRVIEFGTEFWILLQPIIVKEFNKFYHAVVVLKNDNAELKLYKLSDFNIKNSFEIISIENQLLIPASNLHLPYQ